MQLRRILLGDEPRVLAYLTAPTLLALMSLPKPEEMTGTPLIS